MKIWNFYDGLYIDLIYQNMQLNEKLFTWSERATVVVSEGVGGLDVKGSVDKDQWVHSSEHFPLAFDFFFKIPPFFKITNNSGICTGLICHQGEPPVEK